MYLKTVLSELASNKEQCLEILTKSFRCSEDDAEKVYQAISTESFARTGHAVVEVNGQSMEVIPPISFSAFRNPNGSACDIQAAYSPEHGTIYIAEELDRTPEKIYGLAVEELGHHFDQILNPADTQGDEGEHFKRLVSGNAPTEEELQAIQAERGTRMLMIDGKSMLVECGQPQRGGWGETSIQPN